jgi:UDP-glucuronate 4-epimerase
MEQRPARSGHQQSAVQDLHSGNNSPVRLLEYIEALETALGRKAIRELLPLQTGDMPDTYADVSDMVRSLGFRPAATPLKQGVENFVRWYRARYENEPD